MRLMALLADHQGSGVYEPDSTFSPINHSNAQGNIQIYVIKSVRTTISDLCLVSLLFLFFFNRLITMVRGSMRRV